MVERRVDGRQPAPLPLHAAPPPPCAWREGGSDPVTPRLCGVAAQQAQAAPSSQGWLTPSPPPHAVSAHAGGHDTAAPRAHKPGSSPCCWPTPALLLPNRNTPPSPAGPDRLGDEAREGGGASGAEAALAQAQIAAAREGGSAAREAHEGWDETEVSKRGGSIDTAGWSHSRAPR